MSNPKKEKQYKCLLFLSMLMMTLAICHFLLGNKLLAMHLGVMSLGSVFIPFWEMIEDVIAEVYGFKMSMRIFWISMWTVLIVEIFFRIFMMLPTADPIVKNEYTLTIQEISSAPVWIYLVIINYLATRINALLLLKWKALVGGKKFWLRSITSTIVADSLFIIMTLPTWILMGPAANLKQACTLSAIFFVFRISMYILLAFPSTVLVNLLKIIEGTNTLPQIEMNPFLDPKKIEA